MTDVDEHEVDRGSLVARLSDRARFVRMETVRLSRIAGAGHYAATFSCAEILVALYYHQMRLRRNEPRGPDRGRFIVSKGHAAIGWYPILADLGCFDPTLLDDFTRLGSPFGDHPDFRKASGADLSGGSPGHDVALIAIGSEVHPCVAAAALLAEQGIEARVTDMHTVKPLDIGEVLAAADECGAVVAIEEANRTGGLGSAAAEVLADHRLAVPFTRHRVPEEHVLIGPPTAPYAHYRLDAPGVASIALETLKGA